MARFVGGQRDQVFLMPPDMREWLPADHLACFLLDVVEQLDLGPFERCYPVSGPGRPAYDPRVMVGLLLYAYCTGVRSSRAIERRCTEDVAFRVLAGGLAPDHVTIARFRARHSAGLAGLLVQSLRLCAAAGLVKVGIVAVDGTKMAANASPERNYTQARLTKQIETILAEAAELDSAEDAAEQAGQLVDGQTVPAGLVDPATRRQQLSHALQRLEAAQARLQDAATARQDGYQDRCERLNAARAVKGLSPRTYRPGARDEAPRPDAVTNLSDPQSKLLIGRRGAVQGYNAQITTTEKQIIVAAQVSTAANDVDQLAPMVAATRNTLAAAGVGEPVGAVVADAGYWKAANVDGSTSELAGLPDLYISVAKHGRRGRQRKDGKTSEATTTPLVEAMKARLATPQGRRYLRIRKTTVEPVFGQTKHARGITSFTRRGLVAAEQEWQLIAATSNLLKLHRRQPIPA